MDIECSCGYEGEADEVEVTETVDDMNDRGTVDVTQTAQICPRCGIEHYLEDDV